MSRKGPDGEAELILISEAVARLKAGMYGGLLEPKPVASIKANIKKGEVRPSIGWQPQNEDATARILRSHCAEQIVSACSAGCDLRNAVPVASPNSD